MRPLIYMQPVLTQEDTKVALYYSRVPSPIKKYLYIISIYVAHGLNIEQKSHAPSAIKCVI